MKQEKVIAPLGANRIPWL